MTKAVTSEAARREYTDCMVYFVLTVNVNEEC